MGGRGIIGGIGDGGWGSGEWVGWVGREEGFVYGVGEGVEEVVLLKLIFRCSGVRWGVGWKEYCFGEMVFDGIFEYWVCDVGGVDNVCGVGEGFLIGFLKFWVVWGFFEVFVGGKNVFGCWILGYCDMDCWMVLCWLENWVMYFWFSDFCVGVGVIGRDLGVLVNFLILVVVSCWMLLLFMFFLLVVLLLFWFCEFVIGVYNFWWFGCVIVVGMMFLLLF